jgi:hypothetical protein
MNECFIKSTVSMRAIVCSVDMGMRKMGVNGGEQHTKKRMDG